MKTLAFFLVLILLPGCGRPSSGQKPAAVSQEPSAQQLAEDLNLIAGKYSINVETLTRLFHDYATYTGGQKLKKDLAGVRAFQKQEAYLDDELDQALDVPNALRLVSQKYNIPESVIASMLIDYRILQNGAGGHELGPVIPPE